MTEKPNLEYIPVANLEKFYRDAKTGRFIAKKDIDNYQVERNKRSLSLSTQQHPIQKKIIQVVQQQGLDARTLEEVWGHLVGVQAEIAMDKDNGSKATAAAKLVAQVMGTMEGSPAQDEGIEKLVLGRELAKQVLALLKE
ncbi:MAG: hypothetical protein HON98_02645 [Chloroflexi bacterium]|jgi:hypothetical protein|nr:hypothetical protein [Chloroflexota bacterium]MBT3668741.1 hypothetical protein [Chloroflexota bacterium]MBT4001913.1 hypothetical protein [Chloroflexota bacterium]MBT4305442.1 hypothetical protein [Chloroflexota bacterium]MBT4533053.1 hypothetical protein [Chloroflexota bacterium]